MEEKRDQKQSTHRNGIKGNQHCFVENSKRLSTSQFTGNYSAISLQQTTIFLI